MLGVAKNHDSVHGRKDELMGHERSAREASRRFEFAIHAGVPESPQPIFEADTYGRTPPRLTRLASTMTATPQTETELVAVFKLVDGQLVVCGPAKSDEADGPGALPR